MMQENWVRAVKDGDEPQLKYRKGDVLRCFSDLSDRLVNGIYLASEIQRLHRDNFLQMAYSN